MARRLFQVLFGMLAFLVTCELALRALPVSTFTALGYYVDPMILTSPSYHRWTASTGWTLLNPQHVESNNAGFIAHRDFERNENAVAVIGDSFVEASMLDADDRPGAQLEHILGGRPVFSLGAAGTSLLDYAERIRWVQTKYGVRDMVVMMVPGDLRDSLCGSGQTHGPCLDRRTLAPRTELKPAPGPLMRVVRRSALAQYLFNQLNFSLARLQKNALESVRHPGANGGEGGTADVSGAGGKGGVEISSGAPPASLDAVSDAFFKRIAPYRTGRLVILIDSGRTAMAGTPRLVDTDRFIAQARAHGAIVVDTDPLFREHMKASPLKLSVGPYDGHLNRLGIGIAMRAAADALQAGEGSFSRRAP